MTTDDILKQVTDVLVQNVDISIVIICLVIGGILKHLVTKFNNDWIPIALIVCGIAISFGISALKGFTDDPIHIVIVGIASAAAAVGVHQSGKIIYLHSKNSGSVDKKE